MHSCGAGLIQDAPADAAGIMRSVRTISNECPAVWQYLNPWNMLRNLIVHRDLVCQFARREVIGRYKGSYLGLAWSLVTPLTMLTVYTFVFGVVFRAKWGGQAQETPIEYALTLFCGLIVFGVFSEPVSRAPTIVLSYPSYVKKVVFPLEILPVSMLIAGLIHAGIGVAILLPASMVLGTALPKTIYLLPLVLLPLCALTLGLCWFLASLGVFVRDIVHPIGIVVQILMFLSGIFFPVSAIPQKLQILMRLNPLVTILEDARRTILWGQPPDWPGWAVTTAISLIVLQLGYGWFMRSKRAFADVM